jgi:hypothetical protein
METSRLTAPTRLLTIFSHHLEHIGTISHEPSLTGATAQRRNSLPFRGQCGIHVCSTATSAGRACPSPKAVRARIGSTMVSGTTGPVIRGHRLLTRLFARPLVR